MVTSARYAPSEWRKTMTATASAGQVADNPTATPMAEESPTATPTPTPSPTPTLRNRLRLQPLHLPRHRHPLPMAKVKFTRVAMPPKKLDYSVKLVRMVMGEVFQRGRYPAPGTVMVMALSVSGSAGVNMDAGQCRLGGLCR